MTLSLTRQSLAFYDPAKQDWDTEAGTFTVLGGTAGSGATTVTASPRMGGSSGGSFGGGGGAGGSVSAVGATTASPGGVGVQTTLLADPTSLAL